MRAFMLSICAAATLGATLATATPSAATEAKHGSVTARATSSVNDVSADDGPRHQSWDAGPDALTPLTAKAGILLSSHRNVSTHGQIDANWLSADEGAVDITNHGWVITDLVNGVDSIASDLSTSSVDPDWNYTFAADGDGTFDLDFHLFGSGQTFGLGTWDILVAVDGGPAKLTSLTRTFPTADFDVSGVFSQALQGGRVYSISLVNSEGFFDSLHPADDRTAREDGRFHWTINTEAAAAVPEPSTWALAILGFGLTGGALRRRRLAA